MTSHDSDIKPLLSAFDSPTFGEDTSFHIEQPVGSMSISPCGRDVVLASKEGLHIIDLDSPWSPPRYLPHHTSWEVADVQWSPFAHRETWIVSTSNQKALVWNVGAKSWEDSIEFVLHGHSRAITDINFSAHHPDVLATCAVDSFVHCWDLRTVQRPVISFSDWFAGATQVKWNRQNSHIVASSHDKFLRIWDDRMGAYPIRSIEAHATKIYGIDWNRHHENKVITCSLDKTIKFWDTCSSDDTPTKIIDTGFPVWRARHTPFGWAMLAMPQRGNSDLHLYDRRTPPDEEINSKLAPVATFPGHRGQVKEFLWRSRGDIQDSVDNRDFQLVTWGTDHQLRLHRIEPETMLAIGYEKGVSTVPRLNLTRRGAKYKTFRNEPSDDLTDGFGAQFPQSQSIEHSTSGRSRGSMSVGMKKISLPFPRQWTQGYGMNSRVGMHGKSNLRQDMNPIAWMRNVKISSWDFETLGDEITQVGDKFSKVAFEAVDVQQRRATISLHGPWGTESIPVFLKFDIKFPKDYPRAAAPVFSIQKTSSVTDELSKRLYSDIKAIAEAYKNCQRGCIEAVLRYLLREQSKDEIVAIVSKEASDPDKLAGSALEDTMSSDEDDEDVVNFQGQAALASSGLLNQNVMVPVAKACGAVWAENGLLVCFFPPKPTEPPSFLDSLALTEAERSRSEKVFEGFGRFHTGSPGPRGTVGTGTTGEDAGSDYTDSGSSSSSSSSDSEIAAGDLSLNVWRAGGLRHPRSHDNSQRSTNGLSASKTTLSLAKNVIAIRDFEELLPAKRKLAQEYRIYGNASDVCSFDADIAAKHDELLLAKIWNLVKLIVSNEVPLEILRDAKIGKDITVIAQAASVKLQRKDSGVDLSAEGNTRLRRKTSNKTTVRWGSHPFGGQWLVPKLFQHFESTADVQMLAMLSCILHDSNSEMDSSYGRWNGSYNGVVSSATSQHYFPSTEVARSIFGQESAAMDRLMSVSLQRSMGPPNNEASFSSSTEQSGNDAAASFSTASTPPRATSAVINHLRRASRRSFDSRERDPFQGQTASLSTSPEGSRFNRRANSNLNYSQSRASLHALAQAYSHSPPGGGVEVVKRASPSSSFTSQPTTAVSAASGWAQPPVKFTSSPSGQNEMQYGLRPIASTNRLGQSISDTDSQALLDPQKPSPTKSSHSSISKIVGGKSSHRRVKVSLTLRNQTFMDNDSYASMPLLDPRHEVKYQAYRSQYAYLLASWELSVQKCEVLQFNNEKSPTTLIAPHRLRGSDATDTTTLQQGQSGQTLIEGHDLLSIPPIRREKSMRDLNFESSGLELQKHCWRCHKPLIPIHKNGRSVGAYCSSCPTFTSTSGKISDAGKRNALFCNICEGIIKGNMIPCLNCGHVCCFSCGEEWFGKHRTVARKEHVYQQVCPTGCGCVCSQHQTVSVPWPTGVDGHWVEDGNETDIHSSSDAETEILSSSLPPTTTSFNSSAKTSSFMTAPSSLEEQQQQQHDEVDSSSSSQQHHRSFDIDEEEEDNSDTDTETTIGTDNEPLTAWDDDDYDAAIWGANTNFASFARGIGGGLSRGLSLGTNNNNNRSTRRERSASRDTVMRASSGGGGRKT